MVHRFAAEKFEAEGKKFSV